jgi:hypothetical protein
MGIYMILLLIVKILKKTLKEALPKYELEEKYEECIKIQEAINSFQKNNDK